MIARVEPDDQIPEKFREIYSHLAGKLIQTHGAFDELMFLFGTKEVVNVLNATAPAFLCVTNVCSSTVLFYHFRE